MAPATPYHARPTTLTDTPDTSGAPEKPETKSEIEFYLTSPISYASGGEKRETSFIRLLAPNSKVSRECAALKQAFARAANPTPAQQEAAARAKAAGRVKDDGGDPDAEEVILLLAQSSVVDLPDVLEVGRRLFLSPGIAQVDGSEKLTAHALESVSQDDFERMLGAYMVGFTLASLFLKMRQV